MDSRALAFVLRLSLSVTVVTLVVLVASSGYQAPPAGAYPTGGIGRVSIDMDPADNTATSLGQWDHCARINENDILDADEDIAADRLLLDVTATAVPGPPDSMIGYEFQLLYPNSNVRIAAKNTFGLLSTAPGYSPFDGGDTVPDTDGTYYAVVVDLSAQGVSGDGFVQRLTLETLPTASPGYYPLSLGYFYDFDTDNDYYAPDSLRLGSLSIGEPCPAVPSTVCGPQLSVCVDTDPTANTDSSIGPIQSCATIFNDDVLNGDEDFIDQVLIDVVAAGVPPYSDAGTPEPSDDWGGLLGFSYEARFGPAVSLASVDYSMMLASNSGSNLFAPDNGGANPGQSFPNSAGLSSPAVVDQGSIPGSLESGGGVLTRLLFEGVAQAPAGSGVVLSAVGLLDVRNSAYAFSNQTPTGYIVLNDSLGCSIDADGDDVPDLADNCATVFNVLQTSSDGDTLGDACDNCPTVDNLDQANNDADANGDVCDPDDDNDSVLDTGDNCPFTNNSNQLNTDGDSQGNACDPDDDNDGIDDALDNCQLIVNPTQENGDGDLYGDACDNCPSVPNDAQTNTDGDPIGDACDNCPSISNAAQTNTDQDSLGDVCDLDDDNDGFRDVFENICGSDPLIQASTVEFIGPLFPGDEDGDGQTDEALPPGASGTDCDGDGFTGTVENHIYNPASAGDQSPCGTAPESFPFNIPVGWPADLKGGGSSTNRVTLVDIATFVAPVRYFGTNVGTNPGDRRWDVVPGKGLSSYDINLQDLAQLVVLFPPMLNNARAFNGPSCPW